MTSLSLILSLVCHPLASEVIRIAVVPSLSLLNTGESERAQKWHDVSAHAHMYDCLNRGRGEGVACARVHLYNTGVVLSLSLSLRGSHCAQVWDACREGAVDLHTAPTKGWNRLEAVPAFIHLARLSLSLSLCLSFLPLADVRVYLYVCAFDHVPQGIERQPVDICVICAWIFTAERYALRAWCL